MSRDITKLHPILQKKLAALYTLCKKNDLKLGISDCFRSIEEQDALYAQGRSKPGPIVTNARGSEYIGQHQWGIAFDFYQNVQGHAFDDMSFFMQVGALAKSIGLGWGGDWTDFKDYCHVYLTDWGEDTSFLRSHYHTPEQFQKTWKKSAIGCKYAIIIGGIYLDNYRRRFISLLKKRRKNVK